MDEQQKLYKERVEAALKRRKERMITLGELLRAMEPSEELPDEFFHECRSTHYLACVIFVIVSY